MSVVERTMQCSADEVFGVLLNPYLYKHWVVGSKEIRGADPTWPAVGSAFYHSLGAAQAEVKDKTEILELDAGHRIVLRTYARPFGVGRVVITARPSDDGTIVAIAEEPEPGTKLKLAKYALDPIIHLRNVESLRRLQRVIDIRRRVHEAPSPVQATETA